MRNVFLLLALSPLLLFAAPVPRKEKSGCGAFRPPTKWVRNHPQPTFSPVLPKRHEIVVLDAGHGGKDKGANASKPLRYVEKDLTLKTTRIVKGYLESLGYNVVLTRNSDTFISLDDRAELANMTGATLFVSIHYNTSPNGGAEGIEIFYFKDEKEATGSRPIKSKRCSEDVLAAIVHHTGAASRGVKRANFAVIRKTTMPAILIEAGFLSNKAELDRIKTDEYLRFLGWGIAKGINKYLSR